MLGVTHIAAGMAFQKLLKKPWIYGPLGILSHGVLDASAVYHEYPGWAFGIIGSMTALAAWWAFKRRLWLGALFAILPDFEWVIKALLGWPAHPIGKWQLHYWLQTYPGWNWHGQYGALWGIPLEIALAAVLFVAAMGYGLPFRRLRTAASMAAKRAWATLAS